MTIDRALPAQSARRLPRLAALAAACLLSALDSAPAGAQVCGDVNQDQQVTATDAEKVLREAVGLEPGLVCEGQCSALEERLEALEALLAAFSIDGDNLVLTGMNLQVVSGSGDTDGDTNGTGNIILGYDEADGNDDKDGSHNLVIGRFHSYRSWGGIVGGEDNEITGQQASVLNGTDNTADGDGAVVVSGRGNDANALTSVVVAGEDNNANGRSCSVATGSQSTCTGIASAVSGGVQNLCTGNGAAIGGGGQTVLNSNSAWVAGSLTPTF